MNIQLKPGAEIFDIEDLMDRHFETLENNSVRSGPAGPPGLPETKFSGANWLEFGAGDNLPFLNLDPYDLAGKGDLPDFSISSPDPDYINWELGGTPDQLELDVGVYNATMVSDEARVHVDELSETRVTEIQYSHFNGQKVAIEWQNATAHEVSGSIDYMGQGTLFLNASVEVGESVQAERFSFDENGNMTQQLSAYDWGVGMTMDGQAQSYGIDTFEMNFNIEISMQWDAELGVYLASVFVEFSYTIEYLDGRKIEGEAFQEQEGFWSNLDLFSFAFDGDILAEMGKFQRDMGDAWDAIDSYNSHMEALLLHLKDQGWYDLYDTMGGGIDNPFDFNPPAIDPFS
ncbi:hypothetical protein [Roseibium sp. M-1]